MKGVGENLRYLRYICNFFYVGDVFFSWRKFFKDSCKEGGFFVFCRIVD